MFISLSLPVDPVGRDAVQGEQGELQVVCSTRGFFAAPPLHSVSVCSIGQRRRAVGGGWGAEGTQVELGQVIDSLC